LLIGAHISISKGFEHAVKEALSINANTLQFFTRNPRGSAAKAIDPVDIQRKDELCRKNEFGPLIAHAPYTLNLASTKDETRDFAKMILRDDLKRLQEARVDFLVMHPGSHLGEGIEEGIKKIAYGFREIITEKDKVMILLETMTGVGSEVGHTFEQLYDIIDKAGFPEKMGVCIDTCHLLGAGYDIIGKLDEVINKFDKIIGIEKIKAIHLNDSKFPLASRKDRHANINEGELGIKVIKNIIKHPALRCKPFLLETPGGLNNYKKEIALIRKL